MKNLTLSTQQSAQVAEKLNALLSTYQIHYQNLRGLHWNIKGRKFFELHVKFEEFYTDALLKIDEIAERVLTLGEKPLHTFKDYIGNSSIKEITSVENGEESVLKTIEGIEKLLELQHELLKLSSALNDEGTNALMSDYIKQNEKTRWMLHAWIAE